MKYNRINNTCINTGWIKQKSSQLKNSELEDKVMEIRQYAACGMIHALGLEKMHVRGRLG